MTAVGPARTVVVLHVAEMSGPALSLRDRVTWLAEHGEVEILVPGPGPAAELYAELGAVTQLNYLALTLPRGPREAAALARRLRRDVRTFRGLIRRAEPELVLCATAMLPGVLLAARAERVPCLLHAAEILSAGRSPARRLTGACFGPRGGIRGRRRRRLFGDRRRTVRRTGGGGPAADPGRIRRRRWGRLPREARDPGRRSPARLRWQPQRRARAGCTASGAGVAPKRAPKRASRPGGRGVPARGRSRLRAGSAPRRLNARRCGHLLRVRAPHRRRLRCGGRCRKPGARSRGLRASRLRGPDRLATGRVLACRSDRGGAPGRRDRAARRARRPGGARPGNRMPCWTIRAVRATSLPRDA